MVECEFPLGHRFRREEAVPKLLEKFSDNLKSHFPDKHCKHIYERCTSETLQTMRVNEFVDMFCM